MKNIKITNERIDAVLLSVNSNIVRIGNFVHHSEYLDCFCKNCKLPIKIKPTNLLLKIKHNKCYNCSKSRKLTNEIVDRRLLDLCLNIKRLDSYINIITPIKFECLDCGKVWLVRPNQLLNNAGGCPRCRGVEELTNELVDKKIIDGNFTFSRIGNIDGAETRINWLCLICNKEFNNSPHSIFRIDNSCPTCRASIGEKAIVSILSKYNINFKYEFYLKINNKNRFVDFYLPSYNLFIEYNGVQHYKQTYYEGHNLEKQIIRDNEIKKFAKDNKIYFLEIDSRKFKDKQYKNETFDIFYNELQNIILLYLFRLKSNLFFKRKV